MSSMFYFEQMPVKRQDPHDRLDWSHDYSVWLTSGDQVVTSTWEVTEPADATLRVMVEGPFAPTFTGTSTTVWLESGAVNVAYVVTNSVTTAQGRRKDRSFRLEVAEE